MSQLQKACVRRGLLTGTVAAVATALAATFTLKPVQVRTAIDIDAPPERVFAILADFAAYPEWNPYHVAVDGPFSVGARLAVHIKRPDGEAVTVKPHLLRVEPDREVTWGGGIRGLFWGEHVLRLEALSDGRTRLVHNEDFTGFAVAFANLPADVLTAGYRRMNEALKARAEDGEQWS